MKAQKKINRSAVFTYFIILGFILSSGFQVYAEEWSAEQKEIWNVVENGWEKIKNIDAEGLAKDVHQNAVLWWGSNTSPHRVELLKAVYERWFAYEKVTDAELQPLRIEIFDDVAIVAYYSNWKSDKRSATTNYLAVFMKQGDKWLSIGNHSSMCGRPPACMK